MPLTQQELNDNYYLATIVYLCDYKSRYLDHDPETKERWDFELFDDGVADGPRPYIKTWEVKSRAKPTSQILLDNINMTMITHAKFEIFGE